MSKTALEEDSSWAQTFVTVTPQDDGFLREIADSEIVSGNPDVPLDLGTWNIVLRRSLLHTTKDLIEPKELDKSERIATETQTYLQGVPRVELPLAYRDEATQTLYMGKDEKCNFEKAFDDVIAVMNEKPLPEWRKSRYVQTKIKFENAASLDDVIGVLEMRHSETDLDESDQISSSNIESLDAVNFLVDRAVWMSEPVPVSKIETKEEEVETMIKFNHALQRLTIDQEVQTDMTCDPKLSNLMLVPRRNETKSISRNTDSENELIDFGRKIIGSDETDNDNEAKESDQETFESNLKRYETQDFDRKSIESDKTDYDNEVKESGRKILLSDSETDIETQDFYRKTVEANLEKAVDRKTENNERKETMSFNWREASPQRNSWGVVAPDSNRRVNTLSRSLRPGVGLSRREKAKTENILLTDGQSFVSRNRDEAARDPNLKPACYSRGSIRSRSSIISNSENASSSSHVYYERSSSSLNLRAGRQMPVKCEKNLPANDERALKLLKETFCTKNGPEEPLPRRGACRCANERDPSKDIRYD